MSPTKPSSSSALQRLQRPVGSTASIPRRTKTATSSTKSRKAPSGGRGVESKLKSSGHNDSIFHDATATSRPAKVTSYFSNAVYGGENKENIPLSGVAQSRNSNPRVAGTSPTKGKTGISKSSKLSPSSLMRSSLARRPLRELSEEEIFERDEATLGDLRRRRSGEHSGTYIEFDSYTAIPVHALSNSERESSIASTSTAATYSSQSTDPTDLDDGEESDGKFCVLRRTDSEESLRLKVEAIMAATSAATSSVSGTTKKFSTLRKKLQSPMKFKHPALRDEESFVFSGTSTPDFGSPERKALSPTKISPILSRQTAATIVKSPVRPLRMGLGSKSANTILKEANNASKEKGEKGKKIIISANNDALENKKKTLSKKAGNSSLRRAAGASRPAGISVAKSSLEGIRRMR
ncbi:hypothetical protein K440DRAFT_639800 [Wilcoxina mikolae CBS 423.85]|nr:hypothetical protein K440DRAFT_639800 [Wilcoxina mikolae CBS 423.85]